MEEHKAVSMVAGCRIPAQQFKAPVKRGCIHPHQLKHAKFCPECGQPIWVPKTPEEVGIGHGDHIQGFIVISSKDPYNGSDSFVIGDLLPKQVPRADLKQRDLVTVCKQVEESLREQGFDLNWAEFGLHLVFHDALN